MTLHVHGQYHWTGKWDADKIYGLFRFRGRGGGGYNPSLHTYSESASTRYSPNACKLNQKYFEND